MSSETGRFLLSERPLDLSSREAISRRASLSQVKEYNSPKLQVHAVQDLLLPKMQRVVTRLLPLRRLKVMIRRYAHVTLAAEPDDVLLAQDRELKSLEKELRGRVDWV